MKRSDVGRRLWTTFLPIALGWVVAAMVVLFAWRESLERRHTDALSLRAEILQLEMGMCDSIPGGVCGIDSLRLAQLSQNGLYRVDLLDSTDRALPKGDLVAYRFLTNPGDRFLLTERELPGGRILRISLPARQMGIRSPLPWLMAGLALILGTWIPFGLLWSGWKTERLRMAHLVGIARSAERGVRSLPPQGLLEGWEEEARLANALGAQVRRLRLELALERRRIQRMLDSLAEGVVLLDEEGRLLLSNDIGLQVLMVGNRLSDPSPRRARGKNIFNVAANLAFLEDLRAMPDHRTTEIDTEGPNGTWRVRVALLPLGGGRKGRLLAFFDVSQRREAERLQARLVSDASHEFKTPLTAIRGYAETLLDESEDPSGFQHHSLERILAATIHLEEVVRDLLDIGQLSESGRRLRLTNTDLAEVCRRALATAEPAARTRGVVLRLHLPSQSTQGMADGHKLERAVLNLVTNAIKYGPTGDFVDVSLEHIEDQWRISVRDRGPGIPVELIGNLFDRFFRLDHGRAREAGGTGLGLAIVKEVALAHQGRAEVENLPEGGTCFRIELPDLMPK